MVRGFSQVGLLFECEGIEGAEFGFTLLCFRFIHRRVKMLKSALSIKYSPLEISSLVKWFNQKIVIRKSEILFRIVQVRS